MEIPEDVEGELRSNSSLTSAEAEDDPSRRVHEFHIFKEKDAIQEVSFSHRKMNGKASSRSEDSETLKTVLSVW